MAFVFRGLESIMVEKRHGWELTSWSTNTNQREKDTLGISRVFWNLKAYNDPPPNPFQSFASWGPSLKYVYLREPFPTEAGKLRSWRDLKCFPSLAGWKHSLCSLPLRKDHSLESTGLAGCFRVRAWHSRSGLARLFLVFALSISEVFFCFVLFFVL